MSNLKRLTLATLFALSAISLLAGCGDTGPGDEGGEKPSCTTSSQCKEDELCTNLNSDGKGYCKKKCKAGNACGSATESCTDFFDDQGNKTGSACLKKCTTHDQCGTGMICGVTKKGLDKVCLVQPCGQQNNCPTGLKCNPTTKSCVADKTTTTQPGPGNGATCTSSNVGTICGPDAAWACVGGKCEGRPVQMIVIKDLSTPGSTDGTCKGADKGADILGVGLVKEGEATPYAWARNAARFTQNSSDLPTGTYASTTEPDGNAPNFSSMSTEQCQVNGKLSTSGKQFAATGCGGYLFMPVEYGSGSKLTAGKINVYEFDGATCNNSSDPADHYAVYACNTADFTGTGKTVNGYDDVDSYLLKFCIKISNDSQGNTQSDYPPANP